MREFDSTFNRKILEFAINGFVKSTCFAIDEIKVVGTALDELFVFVIAMSEYSDIIFFDCEHAAFFVHCVVNNQVEFDCFRIIKHMDLSVNYHKDIVSFIESYEEELNEIRLRQ